MTDYTYMDGGTGKPPMKKVKLQQKEKILYRKKTVVQIYVTSGLKN